MKTKKIMLTYFLIAMMCGLPTISHATNQQSIKNSADVPIKLLAGVSTIKSQVAPIQVKPRPDIHVKPSLPHQLQRYRDTFGENNEDSGHAYLLSDLNHTYTAACSHREDVDWYKITVPSAGIGSWVQITLQSVKPTSSRWLLDLVGPDLSGWEDTPSGGLTNGSFWVALQAGLTVYIKIKSEWGQWGEQPDEACVLDYNLSLQSAVISDVRASVDNYEYTDIELQLDVPATAYMAEVGDAAGHRVGYMDWFKFRFQSCANYCVDISRPGLIQLGLNGPGSCSGNEAVQHFCFDEGGCRGAKDGGTGYVGIEPVEVTTEGLSFEGRGEIPQRYKTPYTITIRESGTAINSAGCSN